MLNTASYSTSLRSEFIILSRALRAVHARIASTVRFRFGHKSFYRFGIRSCLATSHKKKSIQHDVIVHFGFPCRQHGHRLGLILFILCGLLYVGELQSIWEANNGLQTQQSPIGQVAGNPCRGRFNTERTAT